MGLETARPIVMALAILKLEKTPETEKGQETAGIVRGDDQTTDVVTRHVPTAQPLAKFGKLRRYSRLE